MTLKVRVSWPLWLQFHSFSSLSHTNIPNLKPSYTQRCAPLIVTSLGCLPSSVKLCTLKVTFHIHLLQAESFSVLTLNLNLRCVHMSMMWKLEASSIFSS